MKSETSLLGPNDLDRIGAAIKDAEKRTNGEIFAVLARESDDYFFPAGFSIAVAALIFGGLMALTTWWWEVPVSVISLVFGQLAAFACLAGLAFALPSIRLLFVPRSVAYKRASANAVRQFLAHGIHITESRTGVLLFVSMAERYVEVIADVGINEKVAQEEWNNLVAALTNAASEDRLADGFVEAANRAGTLLSEHFPRQRGKINALEDKIIEL